MLNIPFHALSKLTINPECLEKCQFVLSVYSISGRHYYLAIILFYPWTLLTLQCLKVNHYFQQVYESEDPSVMRYILLEKRGRNKDSHENIVSNRRNRVAVGDVVRGSHT